jgi:hypothetical protein
MRGDKRHYTGWDIRNKSAITINNRERSRFWIGILIPSILLNFYREIWNNSLIFCTKTEQMSIFISHLAWLCIYCASFHVNLFNIYELSSRDPDPEISINNFFALISITKYWQTQKSNLKIIFDKNDYLINIFCYHSRCLMLLSQQNYFYLSYCRFYVVILWHTTKLRARN